MNLSAFQKQKRLLTIAQEDRIYCTWEKSFESYRDTFIHFADTQPEEIRSFLYGYAECGRMMMQRMVNLACKCMEFPDERR